MFPGVGMPCISVFEGNQGEVQLAQSPVTNSNSKHSDVRHHFIRELVGRKYLSITHVPSPFQYAEFLAKAMLYRGIVLSFAVVLRLTRGDFVAGYTKRALLISWLTLGFSGLAFFH